MVEERIQDSRVAFCSGPSVIGVGL
jgi:hypothetical protein